MSLIKDDCTAIKFPPFSTHYRYNRAQEIPSRSRATSVRICRWLSPTTKSTNGTDRHRHIDKGHEGVLVKSGSLCRDVPPAPAPPTSTLSVHLRPRLSQHPLCAHHSPQRRRPLIAPDLDGLPIELVPVVHHLIVPRQVIVPINRPPARQTKPADVLVLAQVVPLRVVRPAEALAAPWVWTPPFAIPEFYRSWGLV
ncbi:hypothetical protein EVG20_g10779 [Dentipellis fragilis]|uniref:Uncharacterized protein n=1 Tax=Dentipellis fragilis TaxID=205917 RepID=A0A4Y9XP66_9AGAM|nr:hypothetical protein EVG20_g10779 [Dentipellis fragilis]